MLAMASLLVITFFLDPRMLNEWGFAAIQVGLAVELLVTRNGDSKESLPFANTPGQVYPSFLTRMMRRLL
jgi:hypothetical protein